VYLKTIELIGFKSFADRTVLQFEPGMTAIVGPNGCGKSNISDAIRWVLGEQSAKALRGAKMEDCIFNGTDSRKALGMAEVTILLADCEKILGVDFNEVAVTRRVFRSGEGQYFLNKTPCRLKDIQRLFMNTGIGTTSYSLMEQGRIDQILSSRPEDRREIFEEASGITRFKADKKEAIRKLEQTEANLLRLSDVIREVKRQIGSLQRQAGKARRYKELRAELRRFDLFSVRGRLEQMDRDLLALAADAARLTAQLAAERAEIQSMEAQEEQGRSRVLKTEQAVGRALELRSEAQTALDRNNDLIRLNRERLQELRQLTERDSRDLEEAKVQAARQSQAFDELAGKLEQARRLREQAEKEWQARQGTLQALEAEIESRRQQVQRLRTDGMQLEGETARLQNELAQIEARERANIIRRERLIAEKTQLAHVLRGFEERQSGLAAAVRQMTGAVEQRQGVLAELGRQRTLQAGQAADLQAALAELHSQAAALRAERDLLAGADGQSGDFPAGARLLLDPANPLKAPADRILGSLADRIRVPAEYRVALEAALRAWLDAVLLADGAAALQALTLLEERRAGPARLLAVAGGPDTPPAPADAGPGTPLSALVECDAALRPLIERLLGRVRVVPALSALPVPLPAEAVYVTRGGALARGDGAFEFWQPDPHPANPLARKHRLADLQERLQQNAAQTQVKSAALEALRRENATLEETLEQSRRECEERKRALAVQEKEEQIVSQEAHQAQDRLETVAWELQNLEEQTDAAAEREAAGAKINAARDAQAAARAQSESVGKEIHALEQRRSALYTEVGELRVRFSEARQNSEHLEAQRDPLRERMAELETTIKERGAGIAAYRANLEQVSHATSEAENRIAALQSTAAQAAANLETLRKERERYNEELGGVNAKLAQRRESLEELNNRHTQLEVACAESKMRRANLIERCSAEYSVSLDDIQQHPEPEWEGARPPAEALEQTVAELRGRLEAMGPVNLVAIEEYEELEQRHTFLTQQQDDLVKAKQQLLEMIKKINKTTSELFLTTFANVNENFHQMFRELFDGGAARLVLANEEDVLESGIEIIARPPGKKLQSVSLLSGGERTLTAVALLFAIYLIRPSPFCVLDELDAALDESNIGRFIGVLRNFLTQSQFVIITHNRKTIAAAAVLYGVTMEEQGISKVMSMKFAEYEEEPRVKPAAAAAAAAPADRAEPATGGAAPA
jgi:chromosome segregation protein